jgi:hypothetical protein
MRGRVLLASVLALVMFALHAAPSPAPVPPKNCGSMEVKGRSYQIKADIRCKRARRYSRRYLAGNGKPDGWSCQRYSRSETNIAFRCTKGSRAVFAIRR